MDLNERHTNPGAHRNVKDFVAKLFNTTDRLRRDSLNSFLIRLRLYLLAKINIIWFDIVTAWHSLRHIGKIQYKCEHLSNPPLSFIILSMWPHLHTWWTFFYFAKRRRPKTVTRGNFTLLLFYHLSLWSSPLLKLKCNKNKTSTPSRQHFPVAYFYTPAKSVV